MLGFAYALAPICIKKGACTFRSRDNQGMVIAWFWGLKLFLNYFRGFPVMAVRKGSLRI